MPVKQFIKLIRLRPRSGLASLAHIGLNILLPLLVFVLVRIQFETLAILLVLASKWRMFAVKPRHWPANIRANAIDILVGVSAVVFMVHADSQTWQVVWAASYTLWLVFVKPLSGSLWVGLQAMIGQLVALVALFLAWGDAPLAGLVLASWGICYLAARHFLTSFDEPLIKLISQSWGFFGAALTWVLGHWLLFYGVISQPTLILTIIGYGLAGLYYFQSEDRLSPGVRRQFVVVMVALIVVILVFSEWGDKTV